MHTTPVIAIIDIGKTNKKLLLFDEAYRVMYEKAVRFDETKDEDGDPCEDLDCVRDFVLDSLRQVLAKKEFEIKAMNFSAYGASLVYLDEEGKPLTALYNYLKPYPEVLFERFYDSYGGRDHFSSRTASPALGSLNSGMQLYRLKYEKPGLFRNIKHVLHLPQYLSYLLSHSAFSEMTSIGCHTNLWDFQNNVYHEWVKKEGLLPLLPPIVAYNKTTRVAWDGHQSFVGVGLHDSSAALIPYLVNFQEPFLLISSGTWCISLNPFNHTPLTIEELQKDCLCYLNFKGRPVKASRLFAGYFHDEQVARIADRFQVAPGFYEHMAFDAEMINRLQRNNPGTGSLHPCAFAGRDLAFFASAREAYHQLMMDLVDQQRLSSQLVMEGNKTKRIFVDGGFSRNEIYMKLLAAAFPSQEIYAASIAQASALGAALAIHDSWNSKPVPQGLIGLKKYSVMYSSPL